jgi:adenine phosphoribosyltransferase
VLIVDDLIATGGTAAAAVQLTRQAEAEVVGCTFLIELAALGGSARVDARCHSVLRF